MRNTVLLGNFQFYKIRFSYNLVCMTTVSCIVMDKGRGAHGLYGERVKLKEIDYSFTLSFNLVLSLIVNIIKFCIIIQWYKTLYLFYNEIKFG